MRADREDAKALIACAYAAYELRIAVEAYDNRNAKDSGFDGMPKPHGGTRGLEIDLIKEQSAKEKLHEKHAAFLRAQKKALRAMDRIITQQPQQDENTMKLRAFLRGFYIDGKPMKAAWREAGIAERTARRYKAAISRAAKGG